MTLSPEERKKRRKISTAKYREKNKDKAKAYREDPKNKARIRANQRAWYLKNKDAITERDVEWRKNYYADPINRARRNETMTTYRKLERVKVKNKARRKVGKALISGKLEKLPCEVCGVTNAEAHHDDYSKPLDVRWLCKKHHVELHTNLKKETK